MASIAVGRWSYFNHIWRLRYFWSSLVRNDIVNRYRRSVLGIGWSLLKPLAMTCVLCVVFSGLLNQSIKEYAPYLMLGLAVWQYINESMIAGSFAFTSSGAYIRQQKVPLAIFPLRTVLAAGFHFLIGLSLAVVLTICFKGLADPLVALTAIPSLLLIFIFCWSAATIVGLLQTHFPDASQLLEIGMQILFYLTPIVYKTENFPNRRKLLLLLEWNPIYALLQMIRQPILDGVLPDLRYVLIAIGFVAFTVLIAWACIRRLERTLVFWI